jgi:hypothetical protein
MLSSIRFKEVGVMLNCLLVDEATGGARSTTQWVTPGAHERTGKKVGHRGFPKAPWTFEDETTRKKLSRSQKTLE